MPLWRRVLRQQQQQQSYRQKPHPPWLSTNSPHSGLCKFHTKDLFGHPLNRCHPNLLSPLFPDPRNHLFCSLCYN